MQLLSSEKSDIYDRRELSKSFFPIFFWYGLKNVKIFYKP